MKRRYIGIFALCAALLPALPVRAETGDEEAFLESIVAMDSAAGAESAERLGVDWEDTLLLAKGIYACTGNRTFTDEWRLCVGEVILNRVASPEFPDTLEEVLGADERYSGSVPGYFAAIRPDLKAAGIALRLMEGERVMDEPRVVYQDCHYYDGGVYKSLYDYRVGGIYFCLTTRPELY